MSQHINLYNPQFEFKRQLLTARSMAVVLAVVAVGLGVAIAMAEVRLSQLRGNVAAGSARLDKAKQRLAEATTAFAPPALDPHLADALAQAGVEHAALQRVSDAIAHGDLGDTHGYAEYFRAMARQNVEGLWLTGVSVGGAGTEIGVRGRALDPALVPGYVARLRNEPVLQGKVVGSLQIGPAAPLKVRAADGKENEAPAPYVEFNLQSAPALDNADGLAPGAQR